MTDRSLHHKPILLKDSPTRPVPHKHAGLEALQLQAVKSEPHHKANSFAAIAQAMKSGSNPQPYRTRSIHRIGHDVDCSHSRALAADDRELMQQARPGLLLALPQRGTELLKRLRPIPDNRIRNAGLEDKWK